MKIDGLASALDVIATPDEYLVDAASRMRFNDVGCVPVIESDEMVGILTERDLTRAFADGADPHHTLVADYMTPDPIVASPHMGTHEAAQLMTSAGIRHLPLIEDGRLLGVLSMRDLLTELMWSSDGRANGSSRR